MDLTFQPPPVNTARPLTLADYAPKLRAALSDPACQTIGAADAQPLLAEAQARGLAHLAASVKPDERYQYPAHELAKVARALGIIE